MKLKSCPSCGGDDIRCEDKDTKSFYCYECDLQSRKCETIEEAIEAWNRREPIDKIVEQLESLNIGTVLCDKCEYRKDCDEFVEECNPSDWIDLCGMVTKLKAIEIVKGGAV